jgi:predicted ribosome quality control (RQC) complex YloA/Tae2 family protein
MLKNIVIDMNRIVTRFIPSLNLSVVYKIGNNGKKNFELIDQADRFDLWFHIHNEPSCHVIACLKNIRFTSRDDELPNFYDINFDSLDKKQKLQIIKQGAILCKQYSKFKSSKDVDIVYTKIENVEKTEITGKVMVFSGKIITI